MYQSDTYITGEVLNLTGFCTGEIQLALFERAGRLFNFRKETRVRRKRKISFDIYIVITINKAE